jgi:putative DNA primase/helicase
VGESIEAAASCFAAWRKDRDTEGSSDENNMLKQVRMFFQSHGASRFEPMVTDERYTRVVINRAGFLAPGEFLIFDRVFEDEICRGFDPKRVVNVLAKLGYLMTTKDGKRTRYKVDRKVGGRKTKMRLYALRSSILADTVDDQPALTLIWDGEEAA